MLKAHGLEYEDRGDGEAVLLIHGALIADALLPLMREPALADRYRLICYRRRGHAGSDPIRAGFSIEQHAQDAQALLTHLGVERAHVVGHSGGGVIATQLAIQSPSLVHSLVLLEPAIMAPSVAADFNEAAEPLLAAYRSGDAAKAVDLFLSLACAQDWRSEAEKTVPGGPEQAEKDAATFFEVEFAAFTAWGSTFDRDRASLVSQPILFLVGGESAPFVEAIRQHFRSLIPRTEEALVPGVNHLLQMQDPKGVAAPIAEFLSRHQV
ncbi:MAG: alpha/beta hydrolase [Myxococcota bacterium]